MTHLLIKKGVRTIAPKEDCVPDNYPLDDWPPRIIAQQAIAPDENCPPEIAHRKISPWMIDTQIIAPRTIASEENCPMDNWPGLLPTG